MGEAKQVDVGMVNQSDDQAQPIIGEVGESGGVNDEELIEEKWFSFNNILRHGGFGYDAWLSCASNQGAQVLLTLPYLFSQMGMLSRVLMQVFYGLMGSSTAYLISLLYVEYGSRCENERVKRREEVKQTIQEAKLKTWSLTFKKPKEGETIKLIYIQEKDGTDM